MSREKEERDAETWDGGKVIDGMIERGDLTIADMTEEEIAAFGPEAQAVLRQQAAEKLAAAPKRRMATAMLPALAGAIAMSGPGGRLTSNQTRTDRLAARHDADARLAAAQAKRQRKAAKRSPAKASVQETP